MNNNKNKILKNNDYDSIKEYFDNLNKDLSHQKSRDDICTPIECVKKMLDYIPNEFWSRNEISVLDPCCGNGNFYAYCQFKTSKENIWNNEIDPDRYNTFISIFNPPHINNEDAFCMSGQFNRTYDLIMANPPYSGGGNKNRSLSNEFIELGIDLLNDGGYLCFITPNNWMTYNNNNRTLRRLLNEGTFVIIDNSPKTYFSSIGSSFTIFIWQKHSYKNKTKVFNNYLSKDEQIVEIPPDIPFIPLYLSQTTINLTKKLISHNENGRFYYRCDLHNFTQKNKLSDTQDDLYRYPTIHTILKTRYATFKQDIYDKWIIIVPLSTYYVPYIVHHYNTTQSVGYIAFDKKSQAEQYLNLITKPWFKLLVHITRYGNFNNIMVLKHLDFDNKNIVFSNDELNEINKLCEKIKY